MREKPEETAGRVGDRIRRWPDAGLMVVMRAGLRATGEAAEAMRVAATPVALVRWEAVAEDGWLLGTRKKLRAQAVDGLWWPARVQMEMDGPVIHLGVRGATQGDAKRRLQELVGELAEVVWFIEGGKVETAIEAQSEAEGSMDAEALAEEAIRLAAAGGGVQERAEAMLMAGGVPLHREHAAKVFPILFAGGSAWRAIEAARTLVEGGFKSARGKADLGKRLSILYSAHARIRKSLGEMTRKLSDTASQ